MTSSRTSPYHYVHQNSFGLCITHSHRQRLPDVLGIGVVKTESSVSKANLLNEYFTFCFSSHPPSNVPVNLPSSTPSALSSIHCSADKVRHLLITTKVKTASGPDSISSHMLGNTASSIANSLTINLSLSTGVVPREWKLLNLTPIYKFGDIGLVSNYRPISLLSLPFKILERIIHNRLFSFLLSNILLSPLQFGFRPCSSTQEAIIDANYDWQSHLGRGSSVAAIFFDLSRPLILCPMANSSLHCQFLFHFLSGFLTTSLIDIRRWYWTVTPYP